MIAVSGFWLALLTTFSLHVRFAYQTPVLQVHLDENRISEHNDTEYVRAIMSLAKSAEMRNYMRTEVDACENFFEHACGNWPKINPADSQKSRETNFFDLLTQSYNQKQLRILKDPNHHKNNTDADRKVKDFFGSCQLLDATRKDKYKPKIREIIREFGQMPALVQSGFDWNEEEFDWLDTLSKIQHKYGLDIIVQVHIRHDFENNTLNKVFIGQPMLRLETKSMYTSQATAFYRAQYKLEIKQNLQKYFDMEEPAALQTANEILNFEIQLAKGIIDKRTAQTLKSITKVRTLDEIRDAYAPTIDFKKFLTATLGFELNTTFYEYFLDYQKNLVEVIKDTPKRQLANYIMYQLAQVFFYNFDATEAQREKKCLAGAKTFFAKILDNIIFRKYNNIATENDITLIWEKLKATFKAELESDKVNWITLMTRKLALEKLDAIKLEVNSYKNANFTEEFQNVTINRNDYVENIKEILRFETQRAIDSLHEVPKPIEGGAMFSYTPAYIASENLIKIPVSLLQPNFLWSDHYPSALKFGTLGYLVAHELIHGFDDVGRNFAADGSDHTWWDAASTEAFNERKNCFKNQYARYRYGGKYLPESDLQAENIADNGAIQIAYSAYMNWLSSLGVNGSLTQIDQQQQQQKPDNTEREKILEMELLPHMNYTNKQLFFISFAQFWCNDVNDHFKDKVSLVDLHAPAMFRVIGPLANFDEFSKEFKCKRGTTMNPERKCQIY